MTFARDIEAAADGEPIETIVIGVHGWEGYKKDGDARAAPVRHGVRLSWDEARPMLDYDYNGGFGAPDCHAIWAWTPSRVLFVHEYDGSTGVVWVPRSPQDGSPGLSGEDDL